MCPSPDFHRGLEEWEQDVFRLQDPTTCICANCVFDVELWRRAAEHSQMHTCDFCESVTTCITFSDVAIVAEEAINEFYVSWSESGAYHDERESSESTYDIVDILDDFLGQAVTDVAITPLVRYIASRDDTDYGWVLRSDAWGTIHDLEAGNWQHFLKESRTDSSLVSAESLSGLRKDTKDLLKWTTHVAIESGLFKHASPELWRCREQDGLTCYLTARELGSPPTRYAQMNRMTVKGDSAFYGSTTLPCAIAEVAAHVQQPDFPICFGKFYPSRPLLYFDAFEVPDPPSPFAENAKCDTDALAFLRRFARTLSEPRTDAVPRHYVPTQIFVAFLRQFYYDDLCPDAIRFRSSLDSTSENWVVFVDQDHCVDQLSAEPELFMVLDSRSAKCHHSSQQSQVSSASQDR